MRARFSFISFFCISVSFLYILTMLGLQEMPDCFDLMFMIIY